MTAKVFTAEQETEVAKRYMAGETGPALAREFGTNPVTICRAVERGGGTLRPNGRFWTGTPEQLQDIVERHRSGQSVEAIARDVKTHESMISAALRAQGVELRTSRARRVFPPNKVDAVCEEYLSGETLAAIAKKHGTSAPTVMAALKAAGVERRTGGVSIFWTEEKIAEACRLYLGGMSQHGIASLWEVAQTNVSRMLRRGGAIAAKGPQQGADSPKWKGGRVKVSGGYIAVRVEEDDAEYGVVGEYMREHRLVMARHLGRKLTKAETVHHIDGDRHHNDITNLRLRIGPHGKHAAFICLDCGSTNIQPTPIH